MSVVAGLLLAGYIAFALFSLFSPSDDPQRGMATGFIVFVVVVLSSLEALLWYGATHGRVWIVRAVFAVAILPALSPVARLVYVLFHRAS